MKLSMEMGEIASDRELCLPGKQKVSEHGEGEKESLDRDFISPDRCFMAGMHRLSDRTSGQRSIQQPDCQRENDLSSKTDS